jgi:hypothetical protein
MICSREDELLDALGRGYVGDELRAHVNGCEACSELNQVAGAVLDERAVALSEAAVPNAGTMWFRLQLRHRQEVQSVARRSLLIGQALTLAIALTLVCVFFGPNVATGFKVVSNALRVSTPLLLILATSALVGPIGGYFVFRHK